MKQRARLLLEDVDLVPLHSIQVVIQGQQHLGDVRWVRHRDRGSLGPYSTLPTWAQSYQEGPKHGDGGQEVPDVMVIKEVEEDAVPVVLP